MSNRPIFVATHPRSCSTAFERVFMTRRDALKCIHEPFGDAFYYGLERLSRRFENDEHARNASGFKHSTFQTILDRFEREGAEGKRLFIKDMIYYLLPPNGAPPSIAPSLERKKRGIGTVEASSESIKKGSQAAPYPYATVAEPGNPTVVPQEILDKFHFTFLIRHPRYSIPSYYRCTVPPLDEITGFSKFMPSEAGYDELRRVFEFLRSVGQIGPEIATHQTYSDSSGVTNGSAEPSGKVEISLIDADDLLDNPRGVIEAFCKTVGIDFDIKMLNWDSEVDQQQAKEAFAKWRGFHDDALHSNDLKPRLHKSSPKSREEEDSQWSAKFGAEGAKIIRETVDANVEDYEYLKQFAMKVAA